MMDKKYIIEYIRQHPLAIISTVSDKCMPEAALIGVAVTDDLELIFDTVNTSRKYHNMLHNSHVALVIGWDNETTLQYEGAVNELNGPEGDKFKEIYYQSFPDGRERAATWPGLVHFRVQPRWLRYSSFNGERVVEEMTF